jgi:hypothetical protein
MAPPADEAKPGPVRAGFEWRPQLEFHGSQISSDADLLSCREPDDAPGLSALAGDGHCEVRRGRNTRYLLMGLLRPSVFGSLSGH